MEPVGLAASIATLFAVGRTLAQLLQTLHNAPQELTSLLREVKALEQVVAEVEKIDRQNATFNQTADALTAHLHSVQAGLAQLSTLVKDISESSTSSFGIQLSRAKWVLRKKKAIVLFEELRQARQSISVLITCKSSVSSQLAAENVRLVGKEITARQDLLSTATAAHHSDNTALLTQILRNTERLSTIEGDVLRLRRVFQDDSEDTTAVMAFSLSRSSTPPNLLPISTRTSPVSRVQPDSNKCSSFCICTCHKHRYFKAPEVLQGVWGKLFATFAGSPIYTQTCSEPSCKNNLAFDLKASYSFPQWMLARAFYLMISQTRLRELSVSIKVRVLSVDETLFRRVSVGDYEGIKSMLRSREVSPDELEHTRGQTVLHWAVDRSRIDICQLLLQCGADAAIEDGNGCSAQHLAWLHVLANTRNKSVLSDFKRTLCSDEALDSLELSPLHQTILGLMDAPFDNVLNSPAAFSNINSRDRFGRTALSWAAEKGDSGIIKELILHGADPEIACLNQWTPLRYSCVSHSSDAMRLLLDSGASPAPDPVYATTALHDVAYHKRTLEFVTPLVVAGCLLDKQDVGGRTPLAKSCESDNDIVARFLLENGANKDNVDDIASTPVNTAIQCGSNNVLQLLFEYGADYTRLTKFGDSILHTAAGFHAVTLETLDILTDAKLKGLNVALRNHSGRTPAQVLSARPDVDGKFRHRFRELLESVEPPKPIVSGPMEIDAWPTTLL